MRQLIAEHPGPSHVYYPDVSFEETVRRHDNRAERIPVNVEEMRGWYLALGVSGEHVAPGNTAALAAWRRLGFRNLPDDYAIDGFG
ncbi:hypothetical protein [Dactylosporangium sp. CA-139066]|uniref:hypothetical protein n=1 Tax=Dactylosporangium sp. CA-139066 TaxID=3239930 RepID=UPI003D8E8FD9